MIGINPFDQPDVEASKIKTRELTAAFEKTGKLPPEAPVLSAKSIELYTDETNARALRDAGADSSLESWLKAHLGRIKASDYFAAAARASSAMRCERCAATEVAACGARVAPYRDPPRNSGRRFLHSTGQAYKRQA